MTTKLFLGFDPGGEGTPKSGGNFGWSVCSEVATTLECVRTGLSKNACDAVKQVDKAIKSLNNVQVRAAGIDAPLLLNEKKGNRKIDKELQEELKRNCFPAFKVGGTVQSVNSLRGGATVQGGLLIKHLIKMPWARDMKITESHPRAFHYLLRHSEQCDLVKTADRLTNPLRTCQNRNKNDHDRSKCVLCERDSHIVDATLCAIAAWAAVQSPSLPNWQDLYKQEPDLIPLFQIPNFIPVSYWMPMPKLTGEVEDAGLQREQTQLVIESLPAFSRGGGAAGPTNQELLQRITARPDVFGGKPIIRDMRISVELILSLLSQGVTPDELLDDYHRLEPDDIRACIAYAHAVVVGTRLPRVSVSEE